MLGTTVAHYRITARLGAGGMGEVYRAQDGKLGRDVAIKVLPAEMSGDTERLARFEREAKLLASLNHPGIASIYGFEEAGGQRFLVLELVEGEDLSERLKRGAIPVDEAIAIARQIAEALEEAHEKGVVHRDLKPGNVKLTPDGKVKVLDFGLAKAWSPDTASGGPAELSQSPTLARTGTQAGVILGTAAYMSPEQARGKTVDKRADVWAFGVVVFEMLTGRELFAGETVTDVLAAVVREDIPWSRLPGPLPSNVAAMLRRCLDRDPKTRLRDIGEARVALAAPAPAEPPPPTEPPGGWTRRSFAVTSALTGLGALVGYGLGRRSARPDASPLAPASLQISRITDSGNVIAAAISPDARYVAYVESDRGVQSLWLRQLASGQTLRLIPERPVYYWGVTFSPDGNDVVFGLKSPEDTRGRLLSISTLGGAQRRLLSGMDSPPAFSPDGAKMAYVRDGFPAPEQTALMVAAADGSDPKALAAFRPPEYVAGEIFYAGPAWSPDGGRIVTAVDRLGTPTSDAGAWLASVSVPDGTVSRFADPGWAQAAQVGFLPDGRRLLAIARAPYQSNTQIWSVRSESGEASPLTNDLADHRIISLSKDGRTLVTVAGDASSAVWVGPSDGSAPPRRQTWGKLDGFQGLASAPDGRVVYTTQDRGLWSVWTMSADGGERAPLMAAEPEERIFGVAVSGQGDLFVSLWTRTGGEIRVFGADGSRTGVAARGTTRDWIGVSRDGALVYVALVDGRPTLFRLAAVGGRPEPVTRRVAFTPAIEPSGERVAFYYVGDDGHFRVGVQSGGQAEPTWSQPAEPPNAASRLLLRKEGLYVNTVPGDRANVWYMALDGSPARKITRFDDQILYDFALSDDGRTLAVARGPRVRDAVLIRGFAPA